jgi:hypothetical protein
MLPIEHGDTMTDEADRTEAAKKLAGSLFDLSTRPQKAAFNAAMESVRGIHGPRWDGARTAAHTKWDRDTAAARALYNATLDEIVATGQISDEMAARWDALCLRETEAA